MKKFLALTMAVLMVCALLVGCSKNEPVDAPILENTATPTATAAATPKATPTATATPTPTPTVAAPTPVVDDIEVEVVDAGFDKLAEKSQYVVIGKLTKSLGEWNQCRNVKDPSKAHDTIFMMEQQYTLEITEVIKTAKDEEKKGTIKVAAGDTVTYSVPYREKFTGEKDYTMRTFQEPPLNQEMLFFINCDIVTDDIIVFYPDAEPHSFLIKDSKLYTFGNSADLAKSFAGGDGAADKGINLAGAKKEMK